MRTWCGHILGLALAAAALAAPARAASPEADGRAGSVVTLTRPGARIPGPPGDDHSGRLRQGTAGIMPDRPAGWRQAGGQRYDPAAAVAASSVLPLGATLRVINLSNGRVAMVQVQDVAARGSDRLLDLSPGAARAIGLAGEARVQVAPLAVPQRDGTVRIGEGSGLSGQVAASAVSPRPEE